MHKKMESLKEICKYDGNCKRPDCHFQHSATGAPKDSTTIELCKYGSGCSRPGCWYAHPVKATQEVASAEPQFPEEQFTEEMLAELDEALFADEIARVEAGILPSLYEEEDIDDGASDVFDDYITDEAAYEAELNDAMAEFEEQCALVEKEMFGS